MNDAVAARLIDHVMRREAGELDAAARRASTSKPKVFESILSQVQAKVSESVIESNL